MTEKGRRYWLENGAYGRINSCMTARVTERRGKE